MRAIEGQEALYLASEGAVAFRLFAHGGQPTLTVPEQIAASIGDRIIAGDLGPGERIIEQQIAEAFAVSRGPVRDAIRILEREGLATVHPRRGAVVTDLTAAEVADIFEIRAGLLEIVARKISVQPPPDLLAVLEAGTARLTRLAALPDDQGAYAETAYRLSILGARACGNERLSRMVLALSLQTLRYSKLALQSVKRRRRSASIWREALAALKRGDCDRYVELARLRIVESGQEAVRRLTPGETP